MIISKQTHRRYAIGIAGSLCIFAGLIFTSDSALADFSLQSLAPIASPTFAPKATTLTPIHDVQGPGASSPIVGAIVTLEGIVTAQRFNNGFFLQTPDAEVDADPGTSEALFVFTNTTPPTTASIGNRIRVTGTVSEFAPSNDPLSPPLTQLISVSSILVLSTGNPLPSPITLNSSFPDPGGPHDQLERVEGMRVSVNSIIVTAPSEGNITESSATSSSTGVVHGVMTGMGRPMREAGIRAPDPAPLGTIPPIPRWDFNPELIRIATRGQVGATAMAVDVLSQMTKIVGVMDFSARRYTILPDASSPPAVTGGMTPVAVSTSNDANFTIAHYSLQRFYDEVNDSNGGPTLTAAALDKRLTKAAMAICDFAKAPDVLAVNDLENLRVLGLLADRINSTCARAPQYVPYLVQGNDVQGLNLGFLTSNRSLGAINRVEVLSVTQTGSNNLFTNPDTSTTFLFERPPLWLQVRIHLQLDFSTAIAEVSVLNVHLTSSTGSDDLLTGSSGWPTEGHRIRAKRQAQSNFIANALQTAQSSNPTQNILAVGRLSTGPFNDGWVDVEGNIKGTPAPGDQTTILGDDLDLVNPDFTNLWGMVESMERYNTIQGGSTNAAGNTEALHHILLNQAMRNAFPAHHLEMARINADFGVHQYGVAGQAIRAADNDPIVAYFFGDPIFSNGFEN